MVTSISPLNDTDGIEMTVDHVPPYDAPFLPVPQVTPFTYRDGVTMLKKLEDLKRYINRVLVPFVNSSTDDLAQAFEDQVNLLIIAVNNAIDQILNSSIEVQDPVVAALIGDLDSATSNALDARYALKSALDAIQAIIDTGRLSDAELDAAYGAKSDVDSLITLTTTGRLSDSSLTTTINNTSRIISPMFYGAVGDGVADDTAAIQAAINSAFNGVVSIERTYKITASLVINRDYQTIRGMGGKIVAVDNTFDIFTNRKTGTRFENIVTEKGKVAYFCGKFAQFADREPSGHEAIISGCRAIDPVGFAYLYYANNVKVENNYASGIKEFAVTIWGGDCDPRNGGYPGDNVYGLDTCTVIGNTFLGLFDTAGGSYDIAAGVWSAAAKNLIVNGNYINGFTDVGIDFEGSFHCVADGNIIIDCQNASMASFFANKDCIFSNNYCALIRSVIDGTKKRAGFMVFDRPGVADKITVVSNTFVNAFVSKEGGTTDCTNLRIANNYIENGITIDTATGVEIVNNKVVFGYVYITGNFTGFTIMNNTMLGVNAASEGTLRLVKSGTNDPKRGVIAGNVVKLNNSDAGASIAVENAAASTKHLIKDNITTNGIFIAVTDDTILQSNNVTLPV